MNTDTAKQTSSRARTVRRDCSGEECPSGARNNYFPGKPMTPESHRLEQSYGIERRRLLNRAIHGWGVVYGFALRTAESGKDEPEAGGLFIGEGLALDRLGRELIQTRGVGLALDNLLILDEDGRPVRVDGDLDQRFANIPDADKLCWLLSAHYAEQDVGPLTLSDSCNCKRKEWERTCETVVYSLEAIGCDECCKPYECELHCCCPDSPCCAEPEPDSEDLEGRRKDLEARYREALLAAGDDQGKIAEVTRWFETELARLEPERPPIERKQARGGCACLCAHLTDLKIGGKSCAQPGDVDNCTRADLEHGVALACLKLERDRCGNWAIAAVHDACGPRRLVKRNDLLFDLINGCDTTRIVETGWAKWHRSKTPYPFEEFLRALGWNDNPGEAEYQTTDFWVRFSRPVLADTLTTDAFAMAVMFDCGDDHWRSFYRVPIVGVDIERDESDQEEPDDRYARKAIIVVGGDWLDDAVRDKDHLFTKCEARVEIEVRGDLIEDCLGQTVDANTHGRSAVPSGNGAPGGNYLSTFMVGKRTLPAPPPPPPPPPPSQPKRQQANRLR